MKLLAAGLLLGGAAMFGIAPAANADAPIEPSSGPPPDVGAGCPHADLDVVVQSSSGSWVRCGYTPGVPGYFWVLNDGLVQQDPKLRDATPQERDTAYAYCIQNGWRDATKCRAAVYGVPVNQDHD